MGSSICIVSSSSVVPGTTGYKYDVRESDRHLNVKIVYAWISMSKLAKNPCLGWYPNHWSVILKLSNGQYASAQKHDKGYCALEVVDSLKEAACLNWGIEDLVKLSCRGPCNYDWRTFYNNYKTSECFVPILHDCQNHAREIVELLIPHKIVGIFLIQDGPIYIKSKFKQIR